MMKKYIAPEFKVAMFHKETVSTGEQDVMPVSLRTLDGNTADFMAKQDDATAKVQKSINFNNAIKFN